MARGNKEVSHTAKCPYYRKHYPTQIVCQGFNAVYSVSMNLLAKEPVKKQMKDYCCSLYLKRCPYANAISVLEEYGDVIDSIQTRH